MPKGFDPIRDRLIREGKSKKAAERSAAKIINATRNRRAAKRTRPR